MQAHLGASTSSIGTTSAPSPTLSLTLAGGSSCGWTRPVEPLRPLATKNLFENTDGGFGAPHQYSLGTALCCLLVMLTRATLMPSSQSKARAQEAGGAQGVQWVVRTWPQIKLMAGYILALRSNATAAGVGKGLIFGPAEFDQCTYQQHWFSISSWAGRKPP